MWRKIIDFLKKPAPVFVAVIIAVSAALIAAAVAFAVGGAHGIWSYIVYGAAALGMFYSVYLLAESVPRIKAFLSQHIPQDSKLRDYSFRTIAFSAVTLTLNVGYALFLAVTGIVFDSPWYGSLAAYYLVLIAARAFVVGTGRRARDDAAKVKIYGVCGGILVVLSVAMAGAVTQMIMSPASVSMPEWSVIAVAAYTFYKVIAAAVNLANSRRIGDPIARALRGISFSAALISVVSLQTTMIAVFGSGDDLIALKAVSAFAVCAVTLAAGIFMAVTSATKMRGGGNGNTRRDGEEETEQNADKEADDD